MIFLPLDNTEWKNWGSRLDRKKFIHFLMIILIISLIFFFIGIFFNDWDLDKYFYANNQILFWFFRVISYLGSTIVIILSFSLLFFLVDKKIARSALYSYSCVLIITTFLKILIHDLRPPQNIFFGSPIAQGWGFPSSITAGTICFWGYILFRAKDLQNRKTKKILYWIGSTLMGIIPLSRIVIGTNDLEDILGGYLISFAFLSIFLIIDAKFITFHLKYKICGMLGILSGLFYWGILVAIFMRIYPENQVQIIYDLSVTAGLIIGSSFNFYLTEETINVDYSQFAWKSRIVGLTTSIFSIITIFSGLWALLQIIPFIQFFIAIPYILSPILSIQPGIWLASKIGNRISN
ncbi:MAG: phosphatase PAP2 family protein [Candidatus Lokiarchaeota archaeon]|nr:phosphatase PAP2 family protein [Candidatus Harpocratesius repetitus]